MSKPFDFSFYRGRKVLVTGASGYIASALVPKLHAAGAQLTLAARSPKDAVLGGFQFSGDVSFVDLNDVSLLASATDACDFVFHLAGQTSVHVAEQNPLGDLAANVELSLRLLDSYSKRKRGEGAIVMAGTATAVGLQAMLPVQDGCAAAPISVYDLHKSVVERYVDYFAREKNCEAVVLRLANVYGPGKASGAWDRGILQKTAKAALKGQKITVFGTGEYIRDYVFLDDVVDAFLLSGIHSRKLAGKACFVSTGVGRTLKSAFSEVARQAEVLTGIPVEVSIDAAAPLSPLDRRNFAGQPTLLMEHAGWKAKTEFKAGVARTLEEFR